MPAITFDIQEPLDPSITSSYGNFGYYNFGLMCWIYKVTGSNNTYDGPVEWINTMHFMSQAKYPNPVNVRWWLKPNTTAQVSMWPVVQGAAPDVVIGGVATNLTTGAGLPIPDV